MSDDHLNTETSVSAELTETGVKAAAKSRAVAAVDRLVGNVADLGNAWIESVTTRRRAKTEGEKQLIEAAAKYGVSRMGHDEEFAERAFGNHFRKVAQEQANKDAVVAEALSDLRDHPPADADARTGPEAISEEFMGRFEGFAAGASTDQLRERWGRILAGEIRKPGTFSSKVLRATDELDSETARIFEALMPYRVADVLIKAAMPTDIEFDATIKLVGAGLIVEPGFIGHSRQFGSASNNRGEKLWISPFGKLAIGFSQDINYENNEIISADEGVPGTPVYILTDVGIALSSILPANEENVGIQYAAKLKNHLPAEALKAWAVLPDGQMAPSPLKF